METPNKKNLVTRRSFLIACPKTIQKACTLCWESLHLLGLATWASLERLADGRRRVEKTTTWCSLACPVSTNTLARLALERLTRSGLCCDKRHFVRGCDTLAPNNPLPPVWTRAPNFTCVCVCMFVFVFVFVQKLNKLAPSNLILNDCNSNNNKLLFCFLKLNKHAK